MFFEYCVLDEIFLLLDGSPPIEAIIAIKITTNIKDNIFSSNFNINDNNITINVGSKAFIYNSLVAYAIGKTLNIKDSDIISAISNFKLSSHRLERKLTKTGITLIDDTYNANLDSMVNALSILSQVKDKRRVAILADILELGDYSEEIHRNIGKTINPNTLDILITIGPNSNYIKEESLNNNFNKNNIYSFNDYQETLEKLPSILTPDDIVLLKGSHGMQLTKIVDELTS